MSGFDEDISLRYADSLIANFNPEQLQVPSNDENDSNPFRNLRLNRPKASHQTQWKEFHAFNPPTTHSHFNKPIIQPNSIHSNIYPIQSTYSNQQQSTYANLKQSTYANLKQSTYPNLQQSTYPNLQQNTYPNLQQSAYSNQQLSASQNHYLSTNSNHYLGASSNNYLSTNSNQYLGASSNDYLSTNENDYLGASLNDYLGTNENHNPNNQELPPTPPGASASDTQPAADISDLPSIRPIEAKKNFELPIADYCSTLKTYEAGDEVSPTGSLGWVEPGELYPVEQPDLNDARDYKDNYNWKLHKKRIDGGLVINVYRFGVKEGDSTRFKYTASFKKLVIHSLPFTKKGLVHYIGTIPQGQRHKTHPHGNAKKQPEDVPQRAFHSQSPAVLELVKDACKSNNHLKALDEIRTKIRTKPNHIPQPTTDMPRGLKQLANYKYQELRKTRISQCMLNNVWALKFTASYRLFIRRIVVDPHFEIHLASEQIVQLTRDLIATKQNMVFNMDITYLLTDGFCTPIVTKNIHFTAEPIYAPFVMIHERKFEEHHLSHLLFTFVKQLGGKIPSNVGFMTDREWALTNAVRKLLILSGIPQNQLTCSNHHAQNVKRKLDIRTRAIMKRIKEEEREEANLLVSEEGLIDSTWIAEEVDDDPAETPRGTGKDELKKLIQFKHDFYELREVDDPAIFEEVVKRKSKNWNDKEIIYFERHLKSALLANLTNRRAFPVKDRDNNPSESYNALIKRFTGNRKQSLDTLVHVLHSIQMHHLETFNQGYLGLNHLHLKPEYKDLIGRHYKISIKADIATELKEVKRAFTWIEKNESEKIPQAYGQLYLAETIFKSCVIDQIRNCYIVPTPSDQGEERFVVTLKNDGGLTCNCDLKGASCCHVMAIEMRLGRNVSADWRDLDYTGIRLKNEQVTSGRKGPEEDETTFVPKAKKRKREPVQVVKQEPVEGDHLEEQRATETELQKEVKGKQPTGKHELIHIDSFAEAVESNENKAKRQRAADHPALKGFSKKSFLTDEQIRLFVLKELHRTKRSDFIFVPSIEIESANLFNHIYNCMSETSDPNKISTVLVLFNADKHWLAGVIKVQDKQLIMLDSNRRKSLYYYLPFFEKLMLIYQQVKLIRDARLDRKRRDSRKFQFLVAENAPQQEDYYSCSVFCSAYFCQAITSQPKFVIDVDEFRSKIETQILDDSLVAHEPEKRKPPADLIEAKRSLTVSSINSTDLGDADYSVIFA